MSNDNIVDVAKSQMELFKTDLSNLDEMLSAYTEGKCEDVLVLNELTVLNNRYPANPLVISRLLEFLQLVNDEQIFERYTFDDLKTLYKLLSEIYKEDVDVHIEFYHYLDSIMEEEEEALQLLKTFRETVSKKLSTLPGTGL